MMPFSSRYLLCRRGMYIAPKIIAFIAIASLLVSCGDNSKSNLKPDNKVSMAGGKSRAGGDLTDESQQVVDITATQSDDDKNRRKALIDETAAGIANLEKGENEYRTKKNEYSGIIRVISANELSKKATLAFRNGNNDEYKQFQKEAFDQCWAILKEFPNSRSYKYAVDLLAGKDLPADYTDGNPDDEKHLVKNRLLGLEHCVDLAVIDKWESPLKQIPATVIDKGVLRFIPYQSFRAGNVELNIYGDPESPCCVEIGLCNQLKRNETAKVHCQTFMSYLLPEAGDRLQVKSLNLIKDIRQRSGLTFEVTPETDEDAYDCWWISIYDPKILDKSRATKIEIEHITVPVQANEKNAQQNGSPVGSNNPTPQSSISPSRPGGKAVYVHGYTRKDGTYVQSHTRSAPGSGSGRKN